MSSKGPREEEQAAFDKSVVLQHSPQKSRTGSITGSATVLDQAAGKKSTKTTVPCNRCEVRDEHTKVLCKKCVRWFHVKCMGRLLYQKDVRDGTGICAGCNGDIVKSMETIDLSDTSKLAPPKLPIVNFAPKSIGPKNQTMTDDAPGGLTQRLDKSDKESTHYSCQKSKSSRYSVTSSERYRALEEAQVAEMRAMKMRLEIAEKEQEHAKQRQQFIEASVCGSQKSRASSIKSLDEERRQSIEKCESWVTTKRVEFNHPKKSKSRGLLSTGVTTQEFLDETLGIDNPVEDIELTSSQIKARHVVDRDLPVFSGDPKDWPFFITRFATTTKQCGFSDDENLTRLSRCLRGEALEAVRADLMTPKTLPSALSTLKLLYGRPDVVFESLVNVVRQAPRVQADKLETLIPLALRVRTLCDTAKKSGMQHLLYNGALLNELLERVPSILRVKWGERCSKRHIEGNGDIQEFDTWLREVAEFASIGTPKYSGTQPKVHSTNSKPGKKETFLGAHQETQDIQICQMCGARNHRINKCSIFRNSSMPKRWAIVKDKKLCVSCLEGHFIAQCTTKNQCTHEGCDQPHHPLLHSTTTKSSSTSHTTKCTSCKGTGQQTSQPENEPGFDKEVHHIGIHTRTSGIRFQIVPVNLTNNAGEVVNTLAFLDSGSEVTLIEEDLADQLKLKGPRKQLCIRWTNNMKRLEKESRVVELQISDAYMTTKFPLKNAYTVKELNLPEQAMDEGTANEFTHLNNLPIPSYSQVRPRVLIGLDNLSLITARETVEGNWGEPVAVRTRLGWTIMGRTSQLEASEHFANLHQRDEDQLERLVQQFFSFENLGVVVPKEEVESLEDRQARKIMRDRTRYCSDNRYEVGLLWSDESMRIPDSYPMALRRHQSLEKKMKADETKRIELDQIIQDYITQGFLEEIGPNEQRETGRRLWYLPIFTVTNPNKPGKTRVVWDAAATVMGKSLNSYLLTGPDLLSSLISVLFKFRERKYAISGDIRQMFHQVRVRAQDQDAQRCLWRFKDEAYVKEYRMTVMTFGAACSPSLAQYVKNTHAEQYKSKYPRAVEAIQERHYVDDYIDSFDTKDECIEVTKAVIKIHKEAGFHIRGFIANDNEIIMELPHEENVTQKCIVEADDVGARILGMWWDTTRDTFNYRIDKDRITQILTKNDQGPTKREVLRIIMSIFDPMGIIGYYILQGKLIMKGVWQTGVKWDDEILPADKTKWDAWFSKLEGLSVVSVPRWYFSDTERRDVALHVFTDASEEAIAAVAYFVRSADGYKESRLVSSKTKVAPNKPISIPRLELQAAVLGARLANQITQNHSIEIASVHFWTDSRNVICWIRSPRRFKVFVAHRIGEIRETTAVKDWRWVPTDKNVADVATKWRAPRMSPPEKWFDGPEFIRESPESWPEEPQNIPEVNEEDLEARCHVILKREIDGLRPELERFSNFKRLLNTQVYVLRFFYRKSSQKPIQPEELENAENYLIRSVQHEIFSDEVRALRKKQNVSKDSKLRTYSPFLDKHGIIRMRSRLEEAEYLTFAQRCPIVLPKYHSLTDLIVEYKHQQYEHQHHATVVNELRQKYVIPALRSKLKSIRSRCQRCRINSAKPNVPEMAPLPRSRLAVRMRPFTYTGVDLFGPMLVKHGRKTEKKWGVLFTCLTTRAVHLEIVTALSTDAFMLAFTCFMGRRGTPQEIYSDNGTNFRGADNELQRIKQQLISRELQDKYSNIKWQFNPPCAPHMGGAWERLVRSVKSGLKCLNDERPPTEDALRAALIDIESIVNSRPLTYVDTNNGALEALTPNHFILGTSSGNKPWGNFSDDPLILRHEWKRQQVVSQKFWKRWTDEYLPEISRRTKWFDQSEPIKIGDVVAVTMSEVPYSWQLGRVISITTSKDGGVRQAVVKTKQGQMKRPSSKLAVLIREAEKLRGNTTSSVGGSVAD